MSAISGYLTSHLPAVISVVFTAFVAPIVVDIVKRRIANGSLYRIKADRATAVTGAWEGDGFDNDSTPEENFDFKLILSLEYKSPKIIGKARLSNLAQAEPTDIDFEGSFHNNNFIQMSYRNPKIGPVQLGVVLFRLSDIGTELKGIYAGYSPLRERLISGKLKLIKRGIPI